MRTNRLSAGIIAALTLLLASLTIAACGGDDNKSTSTDKGSGSADTGAAGGSVIESNPDNKGVTLTIGSKNFTEQKVLGEIYAQSLAAAGYTVKKQLNLGDEQIALKALEGNEISAYPEYTGTALTSFFKVPSNKIPKNALIAYVQARDDLAKKNIAALLPTPFTNSNEVGLTRKKATELGVTKISDLKGKSQDLTLYGTPECRQRLDCLLGLQKVYGLKFKKFVPVAIDLRHEVLAKGQADVSIVFTTDPQVKRNDEVLLEDDKGMFPPYNSMLLVRDDVLQKAGPDLKSTVEKVQKGLTDEVMSELNARVDLDKKTPDVVAGEYLSESGFVK
ncbi:MAG: osmoprotectant transport system substrate-binding protein opuBD [Thermoleophilaceae bacterium]|jgi:osmoprotectant transport system substrate-binding protein|nr:osmoprotectant transport system substrate-binding protein opuBD [Thermoleophilaceae bacterium]